VYAENNDFFVGRCLALERDLLFLRLVPVSLNDERAISEMVEIPQEIMFKKLGHLIFIFVSSFVLRISDLIDQSNT